MTNRNYLRGLSDEKLAEFIWSGGGNDKICDYMETYGCGSHSCIECIKEWLNIKREKENDENNET